MKRGLLFALLLSASALLLDGQLEIGPLLQDAFKRLFGESAHFNALLDERLPRLIVLLCSGASLAVSGAVMQSLLNNPLASPGVLGITAGGSLAVLIVFLTGKHLEVPLLIPFAAVLGCFLTLGLVTSLSRGRLGLSVASLILTGIAISTLFVAVQGALVYCFRDDWTLLQLLTEWQAGSTFNRTWQHVHMQLPLTLVGLWTVFSYRTELNLLSLGEEEAKSLGVDVATVRSRLFIAVALLSGGALAALGIVAFFGLILPHITRALTGPNHLKLIPTLTLSGALTMCVLDLAIRKSELHFLTIGNVSAILGGLFFFLLLAGRREEAYA